MSTNRQRIQIVIGAVNKSTRVFRNINKSIKETQKPINRLRHSLKLLREQSGLSAVSKSLGSIARRAGIAGAAVAAMTGKLVKDFTSLGDRTAKTARMFGVSTEWLQKFRYAGERGGLSVSTIDMALQRVNRRIGQFVATGEGEAAPLLKAWGIQVRDNTGAMLSMEKIMPQIADKMSNIKDEAVAMAAAQKLFDSEGVKMINVLKGGGAELEKTMKRAERYGLINDQGAKDAERFADNMLDMKMALGGMRNVFVQSILPKLSEVIGNLTEKVVMNRGQIESWSNQFGASLPGILSSVSTILSDIVAVVGPVASGLGWIFNEFGAGNVILAVAAVKFMALMNPIGLVTGALLGGLAVGRKIQQMFEKHLPNGWYTFTTIVGGTIHAILNPIDTLLSMLREAAEWLGILNDEEESNQAISEVNRRGRERRSGANGEVRVVVSHENVPGNVSQSATASGDIDFTQNTGYMMPEVM